MPDEVPNILFIMSVEIPAAFWSVLKEEGLLAEDHPYIP